VCVCVSEDIAAIKSEQQRTSDLPLTRPQVARAYTHTHMQNVIKVYSNLGERLCDTKRNYALNTMRCYMTSPLWSSATAFRALIAG
jgi:hypothetical protein